MFAFDCENVFLKIGGQVQRILGEPLKDNIVSVVAERLRLQIADLDVHRKVVQIHPTGGDYSQADRSVDLSVFSNP